MTQRYRINTALAAAVVLASFGSAMAAEAGGFVPLFDGKTLEGWKQLGGAAKYTVADGEIVGTAVPNTPNSFLCTKKHYGDFILELEFNVSPKLNSGIQIRSNSFKAYKNGQVHGYQVEIDPSDRAWTAGIYDEGRRGWLKSLKDNPKAQKAFKQGQWNKVRVEAIGDSIKTWLNGVPAADLVDSMTQSGFIGLQVHGVGRNKDRLGEKVRWRNIHIKDLGIWKPLFDGKSFKGWKVSDENPKTFTIADGAFVAKGRRAHLFYAGDVCKHNFKNFEFKIDLKTAKNSNGGVYFHTQYQKSGWPGKGFEVQVNNTHKDRKKTGGLYAVKDVMNVSPVKDDVWFTEHIIVRGKKITIKVGLAGQPGKVTAEYTEPTPPKPPGGMRGRVLSAGTFALQGHDPGSTVYYKNIRVKVLPD